MNLLPRIIVLFSFISGVLNSAYTSWTDAIKKYGNGTSIIETFEIQETSSFTKQDIEEGRISYLSINMSHKYLASTILNWYVLILLKFVTEDFYHSYCLCWWFWHFWCFDFEISFILRTRAWFINTVITLYYGSWYLQVRNLYWNEINRIYTQYSWTKLKCIQLIRMYIEKRTRLMLCSYKRRAWLQMIINENISTWCIIY